MTKEGDPRDEMGESQDEQALREQVRASEELTEKIRSVGTDYMELPGRHVTPNQIVAYNVAYFRKAAGLTQDELGERLQGWTAKPWGKAGVSAVERSWDGKRLRQFDADLLMGLSVALDVPILAFFLPPDTDGIKERYLMDRPHPTSLEDWDVFCRTMHDYMLHVESSPSEDDHPAMAAYQERLSHAVSTYMGVPLTPPEYFEELTTERQLTERISRLREHYTGLRDVLGDLELTLEFLYERLGDARKKQDEENPGLRQHRIQERVNRMEASRMRHARELLSQHQAGKSIEQLQEEHGNMPRNLVEKYIEDARRAEEGNGHEAP